MFRVMTIYSPPAPSGPDWDWAGVRALCLREARRVLGPSTTADDAAQEATIRAWRQRARCRNPARPNPWIMAIARREALRLLSHRRELPLAEPATEAADDPHKVLDLDAALDVRRALSRMDGQDRRLLIGHYWQDLPNSELAEQLGVAEVTVRVRLHRLRLQLRKTLVEA
jgi:RNA polymerase sigma-70 factor (ECF subfamily)